MLAIVLTLLLTPLLMVVFYRIFSRIPAKDRIQYNKRTFK